MFDFDDPSLYLTPERMDALEQEIFMEIPTTQIAYDIVVHALLSID